ncbi:MAG: hypothetical protein R3362_05645, partial [Rhodothermales bacterium]|nr:hypothetical protein [Rhodothermales bacterium]
GMAAVLVATTPLWTLGYLTLGGQRPTRQVVRVWAALPGAEAPTAAGTVDVRVLPQGGYDRRPPVLPTTLALRTVGQDGSVVPQVELATPDYASDLTLVEGPWRRTRSPVSFLIRGPGRTANALHASRDAYRFGYRSDRFALLAGDEVFRLSPLSEDGRYGFGAGADATFDAVDVRGYWTGSRQRGIPLHQQGLRVQVHDPEGGLSSVQLVHTARAPDGVEGVLGSVRGRYAPTGGAWVEVETGASGGGGAALDVQSEIRRRRLTASARYVVSSAGYVGAQRGLHLGTVHALAEVLPGVRVSGSWNRSARRPYVNGPTSARRLYGRSRLGVEVLRERGEARVRLALAAEHSHYGGASAHLRANDTRTLAATAAVNGKRYGASVEIRGGRFQAAGGVARATGEAQLNLRLRLGSVESSGTLRYEGGYSELLLRQRRWSGALRLQGRVAHATAFSAETTFGTDAWSATHRYAGLTFRLDHALPNMHRVGVAGQFVRFGGSGRRSFAFTATYAVPLDLGRPLKRERRVHGRVVRADTGEPVAGAVLRLGAHTATTDADGAFAFPAPESGTHYLRLVPSTAGYGYRPHMEMPLPLTFEPDAAPPDLVIPIVRSGSVAGAVRLVRAALRGETEDTESIAGALVEVEGPSGRFRALTDRDGRFAFHDLTPGAWTVRVLAARLPAQHAIAEELVEVAVGPGETTEVPFEARPRERRLNIIRGGTLGQDPDE